MDSNVAIPRITVVTPSFQHADFLESTIDSVLSQNYPNLDFIIIDGGSTDGSVDIIRKHANRLSYWCSERDGGQYDAINKGFAHATGEILCWLNSDDMFFPWTLRTVASIFTQLADVEWISTLQPGFWDRNGFCLGFQQVSGFSREAFFDGCYAEGTGRFMAYIQQESTFWRRRLWDRAGAGLRSQFSLAADFDLWGRFYIHTHLYGVASPLGGFRINEGQRSTHSGEYQRQSFASLAQCRSEMRGLPEFAVRPFHGKRITRIGRGNEDGHWAIEDHTF
jgi:glycosyltransferase involved in cell wall biosynthesis